MTADRGLDVTQGPSGELYTAMYKSGALRILKPIEPSSDALSLLSVFPRRGHVNGGTTLHIFGENFDLHGVPEVQIGDELCRLVSLSTSRATCILPPGSGRVDVTMFAGNHTSVLKAGYRFITGVPVSTTPPTKPPSSFPLSAPNQLLTHLMDPSILANNTFTSFAFRLNAGGGYYTDDLGQVWQPDTFHNYFKGPTKILRTEKEIFETEHRPLFQSARSFRRNQLGPYLYEIPVPVPGFYRINLGFAEITEIDNRLMNIAIENALVVDNFDVVKEAGDTYSAITTSHRILVLDGELTLEFIPVKYNPMISAIEILLEDVYMSGIDFSIQIPSTTGPSAFPNILGPTPSFSTKPTSKPLPAIVRLNAGGKAYIDSKGDIWEADFNYYGLSSASHTNHSIENTNDEYLFQSARFFHRNRKGPFLYEVPVPIAANYTVVLGFAEIVEWRTQVGDRRMIISVENEVTLEKFDIVESAGAAYTATYETFGCAVDDGNLTIVFSPYKFNPSVNTIEVFFSDRDLEAVKA